MATATQTAPATDLAKRTTCIQLECHSFGNSKKINSSEIEIRGGAHIDTKINKKRIRANKRLLESKELVAINGLFQRVKNHVQNICVPFPVTSIHLVSWQRLSQLVEELEAFKAELPPLVATFRKAYPELCKQAAKDLSTQYRTKDYPPIDQAVQCFDFTWHIVSFDTPGKLKGAVSAAVWEKEREKAAQRMQEAAKEIQLVMRESMLKLVDHMAEKLKEGKDGKPAIFHATTVSKLTDFLGNFDFRNVTDDTELQKIVAKARDLLEGVDPDKLRDVGMLRQRVSKGITALSVQLGKMTANAGGRKFRLDD